MFRYKVFYIILLQYVYFRVPQKMIIWTRCSLRFPSESPSLLFCNLSLNFSILFSLVTKSIYIYSHNNINTKHHDIKDIIYFFNFLLIFGYDYQCVTYFYIKYCFSILTLHIFIFKTYDNFNSSIIKFTPKIYQLYE